jgi:hypothetical protein
VNFCDCCRKPGVPARALTRNLQKAQILPSITRVVGDLAEIIGAVIGKKLRFVDESPEDARARRIREGEPPAVIESILAIGAYQRAAENRHDHQHRR